MCEGTQCAKTRVQECWFVFAPDMKARNKRMCVQECVCVRRFDA